MHGLSTKQIAGMLKPHMLIYCRPPNYAHLAAGVRKEVQREGVVLNHRTIIKSYDELMIQFEGHGIYLKRYDYMGSPQLILDSIKSFILRSQQ